MYSHYELFLRAPEFYFGVYLNNHQNYPLVSAETIRHSSTYILFCIFAVRFDLTISEFVWLGANDEAVESSFMWLPAETPVNFQDWDSDNIQPSDTSHSENCIAYYHDTKRWHDVSCSLSMKVFICEGWWHVTRMLLEAEGPFYNMGEL